MSTRGMERFVSAPLSLNISRSRFQISHGNIFTGDAGQVLPFQCWEILPGDTLSLDYSIVARQLTPKYPVMDRSFMDIYYFFVPNRLVWDHWKEFNGENTSGPWTQETEYEIPQIVAPSEGFKKGTMADLLGIPTDIGGLSVSALPFRGLALIWNEWFRDQVVSTPIYINKGDATVTISDDLDCNTNKYDWTEESIVQYGSYGLCPLPVFKPHDVFTSGTPEPQKGSPVTIPLGTMAPVVASDEPMFFKGTQSGADLRLIAPSGNIEPGMIGYAMLQNGIAAETATYEDLYYNQGLKVDLSSATSATINSLRLAFQLQKILEKDSLGGTRYTEILKAHFGVTSPDARQQRPEYLGGRRVNIGMTQVVQTSSTVDDSPQGYTGAYSLTQDRDSAFTYSATEHGYIFGVCCIRTDHTYQQGLEKMWSRKRRFDFYWPALAHIGNTPLLNKTICALGTEQDEEVFTYQEAWAEYRYIPRRVSGAMRTQYAQSLDYMHYGDYFGTVNGATKTPICPTYSFDFLKETKNNIDRTIVLESQSEDQFNIAMDFKSTFVRPMPLYSVPGLIDHF